MACQVLERSEIKVFKEDIRAARDNEKHVRKCRRNFLQYCDLNDDSRITVDEWVNCTGVTGKPLIYITFC
jgi:hypothetical protein